MQIKLNNLILLSYTKTKIILFSPMRHNNPAQSTARRHAKVQVRRRIQIAVHDRRQLTLRIIIDVQYQGPALRIN